jgi:predicted AlkP superfamily phosphohydrolase/phosphomutase
MGLLDRIRGDGGPRVAFIGIDGVPYSLLSDNEDEFEHIAALADEGAGGAIDSIVPPESSACWPALTTGVNPGETGVYGFQDRETGSYDTYVPMGRDVQAERIWNRVEESGREATVMNVPVTFPPERSTQRMVSGFLSPGIEEAAYPEEIREYLEGMGYRLDVNAKLGHNDDRSDFVADAHETVERRHEAFMHYIEQDDWDLFFGVYMTTDRVNHFLFEDYERDGPFREEFLEFYRTIDEYIGEIRRALPDDVTLVVASDHGFTTLDYEVDCNVWLREQGWLELREDATELADIADETQAYSLSPGRFYLNLEGREPRGGVPEAESESLRRELAADIESMEGPDGESVIERVVTREEAFRGDHTGIAPDLVAIPNRGFDLKAGFDGAGEIFSSSPRNGMHTFDNTSLFIDDESARIDGADLFDIAPTLLSLMDIDFDRGAFDGSTLVK